MRVPDSRHRKERQLQLAQRIVARALEEHARGLVLLLLDRGSGGGQRFFFGGEVEVEARARDARTFGDVFDRQLDEAGPVVEQLHEGGDELALTDVSLQLALSPSWSHPSLTA